MLTTVEENQISVTTTPQFKVPSTDRAAAVVESFRKLKDDRKELEAFYLSSGTELATLKYQIALLEESEKVFRSEVILAVQSNPALMEGKVTEKTVEAFYRAQSTFVELNKDIAKWKRDMQIVKLYVDLAAARLRLSQQESETVPDAADIS